MKKLSIFSLKKSLFLTVLLSIVFVACSEQEAPEILFIHTNDTHSQIDCGYKDGQPVGGVVERASIIEMMRKQDPDLVYVDAGDMIQGSPYFNIWKGILEMQLMNMQGVLASTFGNHEFDNGIPAMCDMLEYADFPILSCNYDVTGTGLEKYVRRSMIIERKGIRIGITGVTVDPNNLIFARNWEGIRFTDPVIALNEEARKLREQKCDLVVVLSHNGYYAKSDSTGDRRIAMNTRNIDLIIGGHSHTNVENGAEVLNLDGKPVMITQTAGKANPIGCVRVQMRKAQGSPFGNKYEVEKITASKIHPDSLNLDGYAQAVCDFIAPYRDSLETEMSKVLGSCATDLVRYRPQSPLGNFASDILRKFGEKIYGRPMDVGIMNVGGLRNDLYAGELKLGDIYRIFPFENTVAILELKGKDLEATIQQMMADKGLEALSGTQITLEPNESGKAVATKILVGGKPIQPEKVYYITTIDYLAEGNDGLTALTRAQKNLNTGILLRDMMIEYVEELAAQGKAVEGYLDNRVIVKAAK